jgi:hypothetical protein
MNQLRTDLNRSFSVIRTANKITISAGRNRFGADENEPIVLTFSKEKFALQAEQRIREAMVDWTSLYARSTENDLAAIAYDFHGDFTEVQ